MKRALMQASTDTLSEYAPGWYVAMRATDLPRGQVREVQLGGRGLVLFRTASGRVRAVGKYCAHQRTSLATGSVRGEHLRCAFHGWEYDGEGRCVNIQACGEGATADVPIPRGADISSYPVCERLGMIWLFFGDAIYYDVPDEAELFPSGKWRRMGAGDVGEINADCRDIMENGVDCAHFEPVHNIRIRSARFVEVTPARLRFEVEIRAALDEIVLHGKGARWLRRLGLDAYFDGTVRGTLYGPSLLFVHIDLDSRFYVPLRFATMLAPAGPRKTREFYAAYAPVGLLAPWSLLVARLFSWKLERNLLGDKLMWQDKLPSDQALFCDADLLPIARYRTWWAGLGRATAELSAASREESSAGAGAQP